jgi:hypothetical protein
MAVPVPLAAMVDARLAEFRGRDDEGLRGERELATRLGALPIYADQRGCYALRPNGQLLFVPNGPGGFDSTTWTDKVEPTWRQIALASAAHRYPEFKVLLPQRATGDADCKECGAVGLRFSPEAPHGQLCSGCLGLGWRPGG